jgi:hypothetical protein
MKIRVTTNSFEYQGLYANSVHEVEWKFKEGDKSIYVFSQYGKQWTLDDTQVGELGEELVGTVATIEEASADGPIKSDGGSSSYYDVDVPQWLLYTLNERQKEGKCYIKTEEMIAAFLSNDFDYGNLFKSMIRCKGLQDGTGGKAGNSVEYECNKMIYSCNKIKEKK